MGKGRKEEEKGSGWSQTELSRNMCPQHSQAELSDRRGSERKTHQSQKVPH